MRISDWSSDVCSSDLADEHRLDHLLVVHGALLSGSVFWVGWGGAGVALCPSCAWPPWRPCVPQPWPDRCMRTKSTSAAISNQLLARSSIIEAHLLLIDRARGRIGRRRRPAMRSGTRLLRLARARQSVV